MATGLLAPRAVVLGCTIFIAALAISGAEIKVRVYAEYEQLVLLLRSLVHGRDSKPLVTVCHGIHILSLIVEVNV